MSKTEQPCPHDYRYYGYSGSVEEAHKNFRCRWCGGNYTEPATNSERGILQRQEAELEEIHAVWRDFEETYGVEESHTIKYDIAKLNEHQGLERWVAKHPFHTHLLSCDDCEHAQSSLLLIQHKTTTYFMGTTVVFISQGKPPTVFFLYRGHTEALAKTLTQIFNIGEEVNKVQRALKHMEDKIMVKTPRGETK